jgi:hypothetical protein
VIESANVTIEAFVSPLSVGKAEANLLTFLYKERRGSRTGTRVTIEGYHGYLYTEMFTTFLGRPIAWRDRQIGRFTRREAVYDHPVGHLYVGDIYIKKFDQPTAYSYNLWGIDLNPDRVSEISRRDVLEGMSRPWSTINTNSLAARLIQAITTTGSEESDIYWSSPYVPYEGVIFEAWNGLFGERAVLYTSELQSKLVEGYGYRSLGKGWTHECRNMLAWSAPKDYQIVDIRVQELTAPTIVPPGRLTDNQRRNLEVIRFLTNICPGCSWQGQKPVIVAATIPADPRTRTSVLGLCSPDEGKIYLAVETLSTEEETIAAYYHEMGHWTGGEVAMDGSTSHTKAVQNIAARISLLMRQRTPASTPAAAEIPVEKPAVTDIEERRFESGGQKYIRYVDRRTKRQWTVKV